MFNLKNPREVGLLKNLTSFTYVISIYASFNFNMQPFISTALCYFTDITTLRTESFSGFFESLFVTLYTTWRFWVKVFFFMPSKAVPGTLLTVVENPELVFSTYLFIFFFYFFLFFLVKRRITKKRIHTFFMCTLVLTTLGFLLVFNLSFFFDLQDLQLAKKKYNSSDLSGVLIKRKQYTHTIVLFLWKFLTLLLLIVLWAVLLYNNDTRFFTKLKTTRFSLWFFSFLIIAFLIWSGTTNEVYVLVLAEAVSLFLLCTLYGSRVYVFYRQKKSFIFIFLAIKFLFFSFLMLIMYSADKQSGMLLKCSEFYVFLTFAWYFSWDYLIRANLSTKDPTAEAFINGFFRAWILLNFFILTPFRPDSLIVITGFVILLLYSMRAAQAVTAVPDFAWKRQHKVLMFGEAPEAVEPEQLIISVPFNSNVFHFINTLGNVIYSLAPLLVVLTHKHYFSIVCTFLFLFSALTWFLYFTGAQLVMHFKSSSILDWRGLFLVVHHYNWTMQYTLFTLIALIVSSVLWFSVTSYSVLSVGSASTSLTIYCLHAVILLFWYILYRLYFIWSRIFTHFRDSSYEEWTDEFWQETSPFMRDFLYWRPIEPDDAEEVDPAFYGLTNNGASKGLMLLIIYMFLFFVFLSPNMLPVINIATLLCCYKVWAFYFMFSRILKIYNFDLYDTETASFIDYMWYECGTYLLMAFLMSIINYFIITQVFLGMFWLLFFFTA